MYVRIRAFSVTLPVFTPLYCYCMVRYRIVPYRDRLIDHILFSKALLYRTVIIFLVRYSTSNILCGRNGTVRYSAKCTPRHVLYRSILLLIVSTISVDYVGEVTTDSLIL